MLIDEVNCSHISGSSRNLPQGKIPFPLSLITNMALKIHSPLMNESNSVRRSNFYDSSRSFKLKDISKEFEQ